MSSYNNAVTISNQLNEKWQITWVTPILVSAFIILPANTIRSFVKLSLQSAEVQLLIQMDTLRMFALKGNSLANGIASLQLITATLLAPINDFLSAIPKGTLVKDNPEAQLLASSFSREAKTFFSYALSTKLNSISNISTEISTLLSDITSLIPLKIPLEFLGAISGVGGLGFLNGVNSLADLQAKMEDLEFRAARATALSTYANAGISWVSNQLKKVDVYLDIILSLESLGL